MIYLLNTNVLSRLARGCDAGLARRVANNLMNCRLSAIAWFELQYGAARSPHPTNRAIRRAPGGSCDCTRSHIGDPQHPRIHAGPRPRDRRLAIGLSRFTTASVVNRSRSREVRLRQGSGGTSVMSGAGLRQLLAPLWFALKSRLLRQFSDIRDLVMWV